MRSSAVWPPPSRRPSGPAPMLPCATVTTNGPPAGVASPSLTASRSTCATTPPPRATRPWSPCAKPSAPPWEERIFGKSRSGRSPVLSSQLLHPEAGREPIAANRQPRVARLKQPRKHRRPILDHPVVPRPALKFRQRHLLGSRQVVQEGRVHLRAQPGVEEDEVRLVVERER